MKRPNDQASASVDVAVVTVIASEQQAVLETLGFLDAPRRSTEGGTIYFVGAIRSTLSGRKLRVAVTCIGRAGNSAAAAAVRETVSEYHPRVIILVGIAAGVREKLQLGDVVLSERVVSYESAAVVAGASGSQEEHRPETRPLPHAMMQFHFTG